jgi:hypothetical protein
MSYYKWFLHTLTIFSSEKYKLRISRNISRNDPASRSYQIKSTLYQSSDF